MYFYGNFVLYYVFLTTNHCSTDAWECVKRRLGACKVQKLGLKEYVSGISLNDFHSPQPEGFALKTSIEINLLQNKHSFENNSPVEGNRPVRYYLDNAALVTLKIQTNVGDILIYLGTKYYRLAKLEFRNWEREIIGTKYNRYTPTLPTFPYNLDLEITTNGTFSIYAATNTEPFFQYELSSTELTESVDVGYIFYWTPSNQTDFIALVDCSEKPICGIYRVEKLYACRESLVEGFGIISRFEALRKTYREGVLFNEYVVVDIKYSSLVTFDFGINAVEIEFKVDSIQATLKIDFQRIKSVRTEQWFEVPASPYAVRVLLTTGGNNNFLNISNFRQNTIISLNFCRDIGSLKKIEFNGGKIYFDCLTNNNVNSTMKKERPLKIPTFQQYYGSNFEYNEYGYNFTKTLLYTREYETSPIVMYQHAFGNTSDDWCENEPKPTLLETWKYDKDSLHGVIERSNTALLSELKGINEAIADTTTAEQQKIAQTNAILSELREINTQNKASVDAVVTELHNIHRHNNATAAAVVSELKSLRTSIESVLTHLEHNVTSLNFNQLN